MDNKIIKFGDVDISKPPFFLISYSQEIGCDNWRDIGVLSISNYINDCKIGLLAHCIDDRHLIDMMQRKISYYLHLNDNPISYLIYHCNSISNIYSHIHFSYVPKIEWHNILFYILLKSKLTGTFGTVQTSQLAEHYTNIVLDYLQHKALGRYNVSSSNSLQNYIYHILFSDLPTKEGLQFGEKPTAAQFEELMKKLTVWDYINVLVYLKKNKYVKNKDINLLLRLFHWCQEGLGR